MITENLNILGDYLYLFAYESYLRSLTNLIPYDDIQRFRDSNAELRFGLEEVLVNNQSLVSIFEMGIEGYPELSNNFEVNDPNKDRSFFEKLYWDVFHSDPDFKPDLLKLIDPETGELRAEYTKKKTE